MSMKTIVSNPINRGRWALLLLGLAVVAMAGDIAYSHPQKNPQTLIETVRHATARFRDVNVAIGEGWAPATPCVSGPDAGAMGVHFAQAARQADGTVPPDQPQFLIYEPMADGSMRLVGVEFFVLVSDWENKNGAGPGVLDGNLMNLVPFPNRYGLPAFYEMHVWAWEDNPKGTFADWNTRVNCDREVVRPAG
jgi:hypothetical protein